jgi:drug/metabolite transporter (DMT)-like permease
MKNHIKHGITAGISSTFAGIVYQNVYEEAMFLDFSAVINEISIAAACIFGCLLMAVSYLFAERFKKSNLIAWVNVLIIVITFLSILAPLSMTLPLDVEFPELFTGLAIPMHFFPALFFFGLSPFFTQELVITHGSLQG